MPSPAQQAAFIDDGYTITVPIPATKFYPEEEITYRPLTSRQHRHAINNIAKLNKEGKIDESEDYAAKLISEQLQAWSVKDSKKNPVEISQKNCASLEPHFAGKLLHTVLHTGENPELQNGQSPEGAEKN